MAFNFKIGQSGSIKTTGNKDLGDVAGSLGGQIISWMTMIAGVLAVVFLIYYGIMFITSGGDPEKATKARTGIIYAVIGIIVITAAYFIINFAIGTGEALK